MKEKVRYFMGSCSFFLNRPLSQLQKKKKKKKKDPQHHFQITIFLLKMPGLQDQTIYVKIWLVSFLLCHVSRSNLHT